MEDGGLQSEAPPAYSEATSDAPPSYEKIFGVGQVKEEMMQAKNDSSNKGIFACKFCSILCGSVACMVCLIFLATLPVTMIVIGSVYLNDCRDRRLIPIWLIVFGVISLLQTTINVIKRCFKCKRDGDEDGERNNNYGKQGGSCLESLFSIFLFIWIIIGSVWVFGYYNTYASLSNPGSSTCHSVPYLFSFSVLVIMYSLSFLFFFGFSCCFICIACVMGLSGGSGE